MKIKCKYQDKSNKMIPVRVVCAYIKSALVLADFSWGYPAPTELSGAGICVQACNTNFCLFNAGLSPVSESSRARLAAARPGVSVKEGRPDLPLLLNHVWRREGTAASVDGSCTETRLTFESALQWLINRHLLQLVEPYLHFHTRYFGMKFYLGSGS